MFNIENDGKRCFDLVNSGEEDEGHPVSLSSSSSLDEQQLTFKTTIETLEDNKLNKLYDQSVAFDAELRAFEPKHKEYVLKLDEVESLKTKYSHEFNKYNKKIRQLQQDLARLQKSSSKKGKGQEANCLELFGTMSLFRRRTQDERAESNSSYSKKFSLRDESRQQ